MANDEDLARLREGVTAWNEWRAQNPERRVDLSKANLTKANLEGANLSEADLGMAILRRAILRRADLGGANLGGANLREANLAGANLGEANLGGAELISADLSGAELISADLSGAGLSKANLSDTHLRWAHLGGAKLYETLLINVGLSTAKGLESCRHYGPSVLDHRTLQRSGRLPLAFLRGCGLPDRLIDYLPSLLEEAIQYYSCFISYSSKDDAFANRLYADLQNKGVRCWFAPEDMKIGDKFRRRIDEAIHFHERLLLILSENSVSSEWVEKEVETAFEKEQRQERTVLFPVRLDEAVMECETGWSSDIRRSRHIGDFRRWKDHVAYQQAFDRVLRDLKAGAQRPL
jgi:hypothetical protein